MYHQVRWVLGSIAVMLGLMASPLQAGLMTFNVDHSGVASGTGHILRVFGTITVDPAVPMSRTATTSVLFFQHETDAPLAFPSTPTIGAISPTQLAWGLSGGNLYVTRTGTGTGTVNDYFGWRYPAGVDIEFLLGAGQATHNIYSATTHTDYVILKPPGGPDGPYGFLVGTAIPEPSSALLVAGFGAVYSLTRRRRV